VNGLGSQGDCVTIAIFFDSGSGRTNGEFSPIALSGITHHVVPTSSVGLLAADQSHVFIGAKEQLTGSSATNYCPAGAVSKHVHTYTKKMHRCPDLSKRSVRISIPENDFAARFILVGNCLNLIVGLFGPPVSISDSERLEIIVGKDSFRICNKSVK
jgi:hypothetical protein